MKMQQFGLVAVTLIGAASTLSAVDDMQIRNLENRVNALEQRRGANGMINPPARPVVKDGVNLWLQADALFMQATEDGLNYAVQTNDSAIPVTTGLDGKVKNTTYDWSWGFRVGLGYNFDHDGWDALLNWTWFRAHESKNETTELPEVLTPTYAAYTASTSFYNHARGTAHLHFNVLDFELGREFFVSKWLTLRPFIGGRGIWISRTFSTKYNTVTDSLSIEIEPKLQNRFRAGGARAGLNTQWGLGCGWSFFGECALSLLYGTQRLHQTQENESSLVEARVVDVHNNWSASRAMTDLAAGLRWDHLFGGDQYRIRFQLAWEQHMLFGFSRFMNFTSTVPALSGNLGKYAFNSGDLTVNGLSFEARFDF